MVTVHWLAAAVVFLGCLSTIRCECPPHDPSVYICCNDVLNPRPDFAMCCQTKALNNQLHQCCNGVINPRPAGDAKCCQYQSFNANTHMCCEGTVNQRPLGNPKCCKWIGFDQETGRCCPDIPLIVPIGYPCPVRKDGVISLPDLNEEEDIGTDVKANNK